MRARLTTVILAAALAAALAGADTAAACSCAFISPERLMKRADGAFTGRLLGVRQADEDSSQADYRYRVGRAFKGRGLRRGKVVVVRSSLEGTTCGLPRDIARIYALFVWRREGRWTSSLCGVVSPKAMRRAARRAKGATAPTSLACPG